MSAIVDLSDGRQSPELKPLQYIFTVVVLIDSNIVDYENHITHIMNHYANHNFDVVNGRYSVVDDSNFRIPHSYHKANYSITLQRIVRGIHNPDLYLPELEKEIKAIFDEPELSKATVFNHDTGNTDFKDRVIVTYFDHFVQSEEYEPTVVEDEESKEKYYDADTFIKSHQDLIYSFLRCYDKMKENKGININTPEPDETPQIMNQEPAGILDNITYLDKFKFVTFCTNLEIRAKDNPNYQAYADQVIRLLNNAGFEIISVKMTNEETNIEGPCSKQESKDTSLLFGHGYDHKANFEVRASNTLPISQISELVSNYELDGFLAMTIDKSINALLPDNVFGDATGVLKAYIPVGEIAKIKMVLSGTATYHGGDPMWFLNLQTALLKTGYSDVKSLNFSIDVISSEQSLVFASYTLSVQCTMFSEGKIEENVLQKYISIEKENLQLLIHNKDFLENNKINNGIVNLYGGVEQDVTIEVVRQ